MALVRVLQGPLPGRYGKHTYAHTQTCFCTIYKHTFVCHIIHSNVSVYLSLWSWLSLDFCIFIPSDVEQSLRDRERQMSFKDGLLWPCGLISEEVFFSVWHSHPMQVLSNKTETPWKAMSWERGMCPVKTFLREAETKTVERGRNPLVQQKKSAQGIHCLLLCPCAYVGGH